jgi:gamma-glutamylcyclotransferase (GGCT)/AIG2-like uncharacterized protein YtfP
MTLASATESFFDPLFEPVMVFVYGTLKPGEVNYPRFCAGRVLLVEAALVQGKLFQIPYYSTPMPDGYPAMTEGTDWIEGYVLTFADRDHEILQMLDHLEDYEEGRSPTENEYQRQKLQIFTPDHQPRGTAWGYVMTPEKLAELGAIALETSSWSSRLAQQIRAKT